MPATAPAKQQSTDQGYYGFADFDPRALIQAVQYVVTCGVPGDLAEFGCYEGRSAEVIAMALKDAMLSYTGNEIMNKSVNRILWLFDGFEGLPKVDNPVDANSPHIINGVWGPGVAKGGSPQALTRLCGQHLPPNRLCVVPGWFKDTVPAVAEKRKFALIHVDCDYYESTMDALIPIFEHDGFHDGATILFDDWYCNRGSPRFGEQKAWAEICDQYNEPYTFSDWGPYGVTGRRFIVHRSV